MPNAKATKQAFSLGISEPNLREKTILDKQTSTKASINGAISKMVVGMGKMVVARVKAVVARVKTVVWNFKIKNKTANKSEKQLTNENLEQKVVNSGERSKKLRRKLEDMKGRRPESLQARKTSIKNTKTRSPKARNP